MSAIEIRAASHGRTRFAVLLRIVVGLAALATMPVRARAQIQVAAVSGQPLTTQDAFAMCTSRLRDDDSFISRIAAALALPEPSLAEQALMAMEAGARQALKDGPGDVTALYNLAIVIGARADLTKGRSRIPLANEVHGLVTEILEVEPEHTGAHYVLGRLHAAVMRLGRIQRFLAINLLGGSAMSGASWERAQEHLEAAEAGDPCVPDHHFELAQLYLQRNQTEAARDELEHVLQLTEFADQRWGRVRSRAIELRGQIERPQPPRP